MMQQAMLCGDEVKAVIADVGSSQCRFGTAGQDVPHHAFRSEIGVNTEKNEKVFGDYGFRCLSHDLNIVPWNCGDNWDHWEDLMRHGICDRMKLNLDQYPVMIALNYHENNRHCKSRMMEMSFESMNIPALFLAPGSVLSSFSLGRPTSMLIDLGASGTTVAPIVDGYQLNRSTIKTNRGGNMLDSLVRQEIEAINSFRMTPWFESSNIFKQKQTFCSTFREFHILEIARDVKNWMCLIPNRQSDIFPLQSWRLPPPYELPDGTFVNATEKLSLLPETMFFYSGENDIFAAVAGRKRSRSVMNGDFNCGISFDGSFNVETDSLTSLIYNSVASCDADVRKEILSNVVLVGGGSNIDGMARRIGQELNDVLPSHLKAKVSVGLPTERQNAAWIGGSILSICGTFQQLWLTKAEYEEMGVDRAVDRFDR